MVNHLVNYFLSKKVSDLKKNINYLFKIFKNNQLRYLYTFVLFGWEKI